MAVSPAPTTASIKLQSIKRIRIDQGGWQFNYKITGPTAARQEVRLVLVRGDTSVDPQSLSDDLIKRLPSVPLGVGLEDLQLQWLLWHIHTLDLWGKAASARLILTQWAANGGFKRTVSNALAFACPVKPILGATFEYGKIATAELLGRTAKAQGVGYSLEKGALLMPYTIGKTPVLLFHGNKKPVVHGGSLDRALNCITYADAALGVRADNVAGKDGKDIALAAGSRTIYENSPPAKLKTFFGKDKASDWAGRNYVLWMASHVVVVKDGVVLEYAHSKNGYAETHIGDYLKPFTTMQLSLVEI